MSESRWEVKELTALTMIEIGTNPDDLCISCVESVEFPGRFEVVISRGRGHQYKVLLSTDRPEQLFQSHEKAVASIEEVLTGCSLLALATTTDCTETFIARVRAAGFAVDDVSDDQLRRAFGEVPAMGFSVDVGTVMTMAKIRKVVDGLRIAEVIDTSTPSLLDVAESPN